ncbi:gamma-glutamyltransferase family protein [Roseomonas sp. BN140053]|uniref:gamma-glutamyltransferase family protein n=1 Tax=Roseomonas sp. BN140053 TaxID=3391898 RepID=UPI0039E78B03
MIPADPPTSRPLLLGTRHMVSTGHPLASVAALRVLEAGGTAVDAGVAAGFALNVLQPDMANLGGVAPVIVFRADTRTVRTVSGIGVWPRLATREAVAQAGGGRIPAGPGRWVVPAAVDAWLTTLRLHGTMTAAEVMAPAIELAERGFPVNYFLRKNLLDAAGALAGFAHSREVFLPGGAVPAIGDVLRQEALGGTLRHLAEAERAAGGTREDGIRAARDAFYRGEIAERVGAFSREIGAFLRAEDLHGFAVREEAPAGVRYRRRQVLGCGPWCQGPALLQMLNLVGGFPMGTLSEADAAHVMVESVKLALTDRNRFYGDPDFTAVPLDRLLSAAHADALRGTIDMARAGDPETAAPVLERTSPDTTYACVVDAAGNAFSATPSDSTMLLTPLVPGLGFAPSDRGLQASLDPADPNSILPGKRPRLTPSPVILLEEDGSVMPCGTPGGDVQTQALLQFLVHHLDRGMDLQAATEAPRWASYAVPASEDPHARRPRALKLENSAGAAMAGDLARRGHVVEHWPARAALAGGVCAVRRDARSGVVSGAADPRRMAVAIGR